MSIAESFLCGKLLAEVVEVHAYKLTQEIQFISFKPFKSCDYEYVKLTPRFKYLADYYEESDKQSSLYSRCNEVNIRMSFPFKMFDLSINQAYDSNIIRFIVYIALFFFQWEKKGKIKKEN